MSASAGPLPKAVFQAHLQQVEYLHFHGALPAAQAVELIDRARRGALHLIDAKSIDDIGFISNTSTAMNVLCLMLKSNWSAGKIVLMPEEEFPSSSVPFYCHDLPVKLVPAASLMQTVTEEVNSLGAVVCSAVQFSTGYRADLVALGDFLDTHKIPFIVNATQCMGAFPISVQNAKISALAATAHKWMCAGYGLSTFYASEEFRANRPWPLPGWLSVESEYLMSSRKPTLRKDVSAVIGGTLPFTTLAGFAAASEHIERIGVEKIARRLLSLRETLVNYLNTEIPGIEFVSPDDQIKEFKASTNSSIVSIRCKNPDALADSLEKEKVFVTARRGSLRISPHYFNNEHDLIKLTEILKLHKSQLCD
jgi:selenocysteine lyase/cysteine desulfurase